MTVAASDSSPLKWEAGRGGQGGVEGVDPFDRSPAGHLTGAVSEAGGGRCLSIKHPLYLPL